MTGLGDYRNGTRDGRLYMMRLGNQRRETSRPETGGVTEKIKCRIRSEKLDIKISAAEKNYGVD